MDPSSLPAVETWIADALTRLPGAITEPYPDWGSQTFQVGGKHFGRVGSGPQGERIVTVTGDPDVNASLVQRYAAIVPGYYANKRLWVSIPTDDPSVPRELIVEAIESAYEIVRASLPKRVQAELA